MDNKSLGSLELRGATLLPEIGPKHQRLVQTFESGVTLDLQFRKQQLRNLWFAIHDNDLILKEALVRDLHRPHEESELLELSLVLQEAELAITKLDSWAADVWLGISDIRIAAARPTLRKTPYGTVLIISPWNYPYLCAIVPIISAIAAGNTVMFKPSEMVPYSTTVLTSILERALDPNIFQVVTGAIPETTEVLKHRFDKIMLTGSCGVGRIVSAAAAKHLTPVALELGGKSPAIVTASADIKLAARRLAWGKFVNAGQTCIAPDYVLIDKSVELEFVQALRHSLAQFYPDLTELSKDFSHIVNERLWQRAHDMIDKTNGTVAIQQGVPANKETLFFPPTIVTNVGVDDVLMSEELFGPLLPIMSFDNVVNEAPAIIKNHNHPLAMYIFSGNKRDTESLINATRSGAVVVNDTLMQGGSQIVPFGGVGPSGNGRYHGKYGFDEFSYERPIIRQPKLVEPLLAARYPPYSAAKSRKLRMLGVSRAWFAREGPVRRKLLSQLRPWALAVIFALLWAKSKL